MLVILNIVCALAICLLTTDDILETISASHPVASNGKNINVPVTLNIKCIIAALWAVLFVPTVDNIAVIHVPILHPRTIGNAPAIEIAPAFAKATNIPVVADELCNTAVTNAPAITPKYHLSAIVNNICWNIADSLKGSIASLIIPIPMNKIPNPKIIFPISFFFCIFANITIIAPTKTNKGAISVSLKATN